ncbi:putative F-box domain-containing protein [Medicago truncatula]|uniref:Putative F-box domain-containing protein n=1 Tax=Medicago truncatula TaxID=3880 RepID=A0A396IKY9_MEDTR|nr:putative F-box domain-containing protein [Medicago truncatula]
MAEGRSDGEEDDPNDIVPTSLTLTPETITSPPPLPILPFDVLTDILCMLPVKLLVQLRCLCKFFNSLISDPKFVKKHLQSSTKRRHLMLTTIDHQQQFVMYDSPIPSLFSTSTIVAQTQLYPPNGDTYASVKCSCDGIFLGTDYWKRIDDIPYYCTICRSGLYVSGAVNWYEYGNQESWTKLCSVPDMHDHGFQASAAVYISEDDQLLLQCYEFDSGEEKLVVYDSKTGIFNILEFQNNYEHISQKVYIESLISP